MQLILRRSRFAAARSRPISMLQVRAFSTTGTPSWKWIPPPARPQQTLEEEAQDQPRESLPKPVHAQPISVVKGIHLTAEEVISAFQLNGAENIVRKPCGKMADAMVIATARSSLHAKMLAQLVVKATKDRRLKMFNPKKPIEGEEDWFLVDTGKLMIHIFGSEDERLKVGLEQHLDDLARRKKELHALDTGIEEEIEQNAEVTSRLDK